MLWNAKNAEVSIGNTKMIDTAEKSYPEAYLRKYRR